MKRRLLTILLALVCFTLPAMAETDGDAILAAARQSVHFFDPYGEDYEQQRYLYRVQPDGDGWLVTVTVPCRDTTVDFFEVRFDQNGVLQQTVVDPLGMALDLEQTDHRLAFKAYCEEYGPYYDWPMEAHIEYDGLFGTSDYRMPTEGDLSAEEAIAIASEALREASVYSPEEFDALKVTAMLNREGTHFSNQWMVLFYVVDESQGYPIITGPDQFMISNPEGEIVQVMLAKDGNG